MAATKRLVLFDIDGTLVRTNGAGKDALRLALHEEFGVETPQVDIDYGGRTDRSIARELFGINHVEPSEKNFAKLYRRYLAELKAQLPKTQGTLLPGVRPLLEQLRGHNEAFVGLLTGNIEQGAFVKLAHFSIDSYFRFGGFGDHHEARDDIAREGVRSAERVLGKSFVGAQIVVIGDTPHDVTCSRAIGARCLAVCTGYAPRQSLEAAKPELLMEDMTETDRILDIIFS